MQIVQPCNNSGWYDPEFIGQFGIVDFDWSNAKQLWANQKPMDCEERLVTQASDVKAVSPSSRIFVYRNLVKALPWFTSVREKISDPAYSGWFLKFSGSGNYHVPACDNNYDPPLCSEYYHGEFALACTPVLEQQPPARLSVAPSCCEPQPGAAHPGVCVCFIALLLLRRDGCRSAVLPEIALTLVPHCPTHPNAPCPHPQTKTRRLSIRTAMARAWMPAIAAACHAASTCGTTATSRCVNGW